MDFSVVIPIYRCEEFVRELCERLEQVLSELEGVEAYEIILVEDYGPDDSWQTIKDIAAHNSQVRGAQLSRNFGQHNAITAGLHLARGRWVAIMDGDLQDPPEDIKRLWEARGPEIDMVCARRPKRKHSWWRRLGSKMAFKTFSLVSGVTLDPAITNFRIFSRTVVEAYLSLGERNRVVGPHMVWLGFNTAYVDLSHDARPHGKSSYSLAKLMTLATGIILSHSNRPLMISIMFGVTVCLITLCVMAYALYTWSTRDALVQGWMSLILSIWFLGGAIIANLGLLGVYLGRVYDETKGRPNFVIARTVNMQNAIPLQRFSIDRNAAITAIEKE